MKRVAVDFDGTLADTNALVRALVNYKHGTSLQASDITEWDWWSKNNLEPDFWSAYDLMDTTHLRRAIRPTSPLACASIKYLQQTGRYSFEVVTMNHGKAADDMIAWLFGHGLDIPVRAVGRIEVGKKAALDYDLFIDDAPSLAEAVGGLPSKQMILYDQPWNRNVVATANVRRMTDWRQAIELVEGLSR